MSAIKLFCCHLDCGPGTTATWGYWIEPTPDGVSHSCDRHLGEMLPADGSTHHTTATRFNVWHLDDGYDGTMYSADDIAAAKLAE